MSKYIITFFDEQFGMIQEAIESVDEEMAFKQFFKMRVQGYTQDLEGFQCFLEDFNDPKKPLGSIILDKNKDV